MPSPKPAGSATTKTALALLEDLQERLVERQLKATIDETNWSLLAVNPYHANLSQRVVLAEDPAGVLTWYWAWDNDSDDEQPGQHERICPGVAIAEASIRVARVISSHRMATSLDTGHGETNSKSGGEVTHRLTGA